MIVRDEILFSGFSEAVSKFRSDQLTLGELVFTLQPIVENIDVASSQEREELRAWWGGLDEVYAVLLDENRDAVLAETKSVREALSRLEAVIYSMQSRQDRM